MKQKSLFVLALLCMTVQGAWAWDGSGTQNDPYLIQNLQDWKSLASEVALQHNQAGVFFKLTADINLEGNSIGSETLPFSGTFDGAGHTLTYNQGSSKPEGIETVDDYCAPFVRLDGATIRHLNVTGGIFSSHKYAASIVSIIDGDKPTTLLDCNSNCLLWADNKLRDDATFGGLVGLVKESCKADPVIKDCMFTGSITAFSSYSGGFVGYTNRPIAFEHCMFDAKEISSSVGCATYVRVPSGVECTFKNCYYTSAWDKEQGTPVFNKVIVPDRCIGKIVSESTVNFNGVEYWQDGAMIELSAPDDVPFHHWNSNIGGCFISNPWQRSGVQVVRDVTRQPNFAIETSKPTSKKVRKIDGTEYLYLGIYDYHLYLSDELCRQKGFYLNSDGWLVKKIGNKEVFITAVNGWDSGNIPKEGAQIHNDLSGFFNDYTLMACIAPYAFKGCTELKTLYFKDTDATIYEAQSGFDFTIGDMAFANCPNLTEVKMMQYTTEGSNHWEALKPNQVSYVAANVFEESPNANFSTDASEYQNYMGSEVWKEQRKRIIVYNHTFDYYEFDEGGATYNLFYTTNGDAIKNNNEGHDAILQQIQLWNADYKQFNAAQLLSNSDENIWYTQVLGTNDEYLDSKDGVMRIYNDPGSYYNYKTIAIRSLGESKSVKSIEFWQTNGRSSNSLSEPKMVIMNNALKGCDNLKEIRLFYYVQDGDNRWTALGPKDVIPGDNIFGVKRYTQEDFNKETVDISKDPKAPKDLKILVSPDLYPEFLNDPNWQPYLGFIEPVDFSPSQKKDFTIDGLTYGFMTSPGGILQTSQTVSQDVSWWTVPRIAIEVVLWATSIYSALAKPGATALTSANTAVRNAAHELATAEANQTLVAPVATNIRKAFETMATDDMVEIIGSLQGQQAADYLISEAGIQSLKDHALVNAAGEFMLGTQTLQTMADGVATHAKFLEAALAFRKVIPTTESLTAAITAKNSALTTAQNALNALLAKDAFVNLIGPFGKVGATMSATAGLIASKCWGGSGSYNADMLNKGIRDNIIANMHQVSLVGGSYVITTPSKNVIYHTYIKDVPNDKANVTIYAGYDDDDNSYTSDRTMTFALKAFRDHKNLKTVCFHSMEGQSSNAGVPMLFTIPDSAFVGCDNLVEFSTLLKDNEGGTRPLGPESFILGGDSIFAGLDPAKFHIVIDPSRKDDFLESESWKPLERYFTYREALPVAQLTEYGAKYAFAYENNSILREHKVSGHRIQHTEVIGADDKFITEHQGALKLCNDIGEWHNYQLDAVHRKAFMGNENLRVVNFTDLFGKGAFGNSYTGLEMTLGDSCFANCKNLANLDLLYLVTDGTNCIDPIKPSQVKIGNGILEGTTARIKMMPEQVEWFEADTTWAKYKDRFLPCIIHPSDEGIKKALKLMAYYDMAHEGNDWKLWDDYIDLARLSGAGFSWLDGKFREQSDNILSFNDFKHFDSVGLDYVGKEWFRGCRKMSNIQLPKTIKTIQPYAFASCDKLAEIKLPANVEKIEECAFADCKALNSIFVEGKTPAQLGNAAFEKNADLKIYVPAASRDSYLSAWAEYKDYIVSDKEYKVNKVVTVKEMGKLAEALGLYVEWSNSGARAGNEPRYIHGNYSKYDSLTVVGPLNSLDLWVIRYLAGNNGYERGTVPTDGQLRYLNLYDADIKKDNNCDANYINLSTAVFHNGWMDVVEDNTLPAYLFYKCTPLETVILPKSLKKISGRIFEGCSNLKHLAITSPLEDYDEKLYIGGIIDYPLEELVFVGDDKANSTRKDPWGKTLLAVYTTNAQYTNYLNDPCVINQAKNIIAPFEDDAIWTMMARHGEFFPSLIAEKEDVGRIFSEVFEEKKLKSFDEFQFFNKVKRLNETFSYNENLERVSIPASVEYISADAFVNCFSLKTIRMKGDTVPELGNDPFRHLPKDFVIYVPRDVVKVYRTKWAQYADHINPENTAASYDDILTVTLEEPNTLAEKLGLTANWVDGKKVNKKVKLLNGVRGNYTKITKLKVVGPISGGDLVLMRYLAGFCSWSNSRNYAARLEYIDLYDAVLKTSNYCVAPDAYTSREVVVDAVNVLPAYSFLQCYNLKTLILPRTLKEVRSRALQQCEAMETLVLGDDLVEFNWNALDDDASLTRMYILAKNKVKISTENTIWQWLCNNYNPTFDAFYVRPSQYENYLNDPAYTGSSWQRTNNVSKGAFEDDDAFVAFASHAAATPDELITISSVDGWFDANPGVKDLTPLRYTAIDSLKKATVAPLTQLEKVAMPYTLIGLEDGVFENAKGLRYADFLFCDSTEIVSKLHDGAFKRLGINTDQALVYVPETYGESDGTNIVARGRDGKYKAKAFRMVDSLDYLVPYEFETGKIENSRSLHSASVPYTFCVPYKLNVPAYSRAYALSERDGNTLVFKEVKGELEALQPYLLKVVGNKRLRKTTATLNTEISQTIPASNPNTYGHQVDAAGYSLRGTLEGFDNKTANELGAYILQSDGNWHPVSSTTAANKKAVILPFRAFLLPSTHNANASISMELEDADGIETIETIDADGTEHYYDLQGRELPGKPSKGIYIHNGKKVVAK